MSKEIVTAAKEEKPKSKGGRPLKHVDENLLKALAQIHCTMKEMSSVVGVSVDTLESRFAELIRVAQEGGKSSLRREQWKAAQKGNIHMLIWLGKQWLGQRDRQPDEAPNTVINVMVNESP